MAKKKIETPKLDLLTKEIEVLKASEAEAKDKMLRAIADSQNAQKRMQKEKEDFQKYMLTRFASALLPVADNLRRALDASKAAPLDKASKDIVLGVEGTEKELLKAFESFKITAFSDLGRIFDPNRHCVVFQQPDDKLEAGTIMQIVQKGYMIEDRLLREAMVGVSKKSINKDSVEPVSQKV